MTLDRVPAGKDVPNDCNVIIEIPMRGDPIKYEVDKETGAVFVDRFMSTAMHYPCNYGYIPRTLSDDGDPCDVLLLSPMPLITGVVVRFRPIGMLKMDDEAGGDSKVLAVPVDKLTGLYRNVQSPRDLPEITTQQIAHFFEHYKDLEPGKWVRVSTWVGADEAKREILDGVARYEAAHAGREDLIAMTTAAHARRQLAFPLLFVFCGAPASSRPSTGSRTRRRSVSALPLRARRGADGRGRAGDARAVAGDARGSRDTSSSPDGSSMASTWAACWWRSRAACRPEWRRCSSACSRSSR